MSDTTTSQRCDSDQHDKCDGTVRVFDQDGPGRWTCRCSCHNRRFAERECIICEGTGRLHEMLLNGEFSTVPGPVPSDSS